MATPEALAIRAAEAAERYTESNHAINARLEKIEAELAAGHVAEAAERYTESNHAIHARLEKIEADLAAVLAAVKGQAGGKFGAAVDASPVGKPAVSAAPVPKPADKK